MPEFNSPSAMRDRGLFVTSTCHFFQRARPLSFRWIRNSLAHLLTADEIRPGPPRPQMSDDFRFIYNLFGWRRGMINASTLFLCTCACVALNLCVCFFCIIYCVCAWKMAWRTCVDSALTAICFHLYRLYYVLFAKLHHLVAQLCCYRNFFWRLNCRDF